MQSSSSTSQHKMILTLCTGMLHHVMPSCLGWFGPSKEQKKAKAEFEKWQKKFNERSPTGGIRAYFFDLRSLHSLCHNWHLSSGLPLCPFDLISFDFNTHRFTSLSLPFSCTNTCIRVSLQGQCHYPLLIYPPPGRASLSSRA